jgi:hypothetical protein
MKKTATIDYVAEKPREFGDTGAAVKVIFLGGEEGEFATGRQWAQGHIDALKKLIGKESEFEGEETQYGFKLKEYPGKPTGGGGGAKKGDWADRTERIWKENRIAATSAVKYCMELTEGPLMDRIKAAETYAPDVFLIIQGLAPEPAAVVSSSAPTATSNGGGSGRTAELISLAGGDATAVPRAKRLLLHYEGHDEFDKLDADQWAAFKVSFGGAETTRKVTEEAAPSRA